MSYALGVRPCLACVGLAPPFEFIDGIHHRVIIVAKVSAPVGVLARARPSHTARQPTPVLLCATDENQPPATQRTSNLREFSMGVGYDDQLKRRFWG